MGHGTWDATATTMGAAMCWTHKIEGAKDFVDGIARANAVKK